MTMIDDTRSLRDAQADALRAALYEVGRYDLARGVVPDYDDEDGPFVLHRSHDDLAIIAKAFEVTGLSRLCAVHRPKGWSIDCPDCDEAARISNERWGPHDTQNG